MNNTGAGLKIKYLDNPRDWVRAGVVLQWRRKWFRCGCSFACFQVSYEWRSEGSPVTDRLAAVILPDERIEKEAKQIINGLYTNEQKAFVDGARWARKMIDEDGK